jgi:hypothetical protein
VRLNRAGVDEALRRIARDEMHFRKFVHACSQDSGKQGTRPNGNTHDCDAAASATSGCRISAQLPMRCEGSGYADLSEPESSEAQNGDARVRSPVRR